MSARRRVVLVGPRPSARGGIAQFSWQLARAVGQEADTRIFGFSRLYPRFTRAGRRTPDPARRELETGVDLGLLPWSIKTWRIAMHEIEAFGPDLVVLQWWHPSLAPCMTYLAMRARAMGAHVTFVCHNGQPHERFPFVRWLSKLALAHGNSIIALSGGVADQLHTLLPQKPIFVLAHPPNLGLEPDPVARAAWKIRIGTDPMILFFGHVRPYKGLEDLITAFASVRRRRRATLVVAGTFFEPVERFRALAVSCGVADSVQLYPEYVPDDEVASLFSLADVLALPYRTASQSGIVPLAALTGTPVVATAVGGIPEAIGDRGLLVPPGDVRALADALERALRDPPPPPALPEGGWDRWRETLLAVAGAIR